MKKLFILLIAILCLNIFPEDIIIFKNKKLYKKKLKEFKKWEKILPEINNNIKGEQSLVIEIKKKTIKSINGIYEFLILKKIDMLFYKIFIFTTIGVFISLIAYFILKLIILKSNKKEITEKKAFKSFLFIKILKEEYKSINFFELTISNVINKFNVKKTELPNGIILFTLSATKKESEFLKGVDIFGYILKRIKIAGLIHSEDIKIINNKIIDFYTLYSCIEFIETLDKEELFTTESSINDVKEDIALEKTKNTDLNNIIGKQNIYRIIL